MVCYDRPLFENRVVCISSDFVLSAQISSCFNDEKTYFSVLEAPSMKKYWKNDVIKLNNLLVRISPAYIVFAGLETKSINYIKNQLNLSEKRFIYINKKTEIKILIELLELKTKGILECPPDREKIAHALLEAKRNKQRLIVKSDCEYKISEVKNRDHIIATDSLENLSPVLLANYAYSIEADLKVFSGKTNYSPREIYEIIGDLDTEDSRGTTARTISTKIEIDLKIELPNISQYKFVTFFTSDFDYGYFFKEIPSTHIYNTIVLGYFLATSTFTHQIEIRSAVLVDTGFFRNSETDDISDNLSVKNVHVKELREDQFDNVQLDNTLQFYPYDFLFICSHGGFPSGERFKIEFIDSSNVDHEMVVDVIDSFQPTNRGTGVDRIIEVKTFYEFVELDGKAWYQKEYKKGSSKTLVEEFLAIGRGSWKVLERTKIEEAKHCNIIATQDPLGPYMPMIHGISDPQSTPFVFNNACVSSYTLGVNFIAAGASFYIGTVKKVLTSDAVKVAKMYFDKTVIQGKTLAISLWEAQREVDLENTDFVYTCVGCHFQSFTFIENEDNLSHLKQRLRLNVIKRRRSLVGESLEENVMQKHNDAMEFLIKEYSSI